MDNKIKFQSPVDNEYLKPDVDFFLGCRDIVDKGNLGYQFEKPCFVEDGIFKSYHTSQELFYRCDCCHCSHYKGSNNLSGSPCEIATEIHRRDPDVINRCKELGINVDDVFYSSNWIVKCDAYDEIKELNFIRNMREMVGFIEATFNKLGGWDGVEGYYGFSIPTDPETEEPIYTISEYWMNGGEFEYIPDEFPCVIYFDYEFDMPGRDHLKWLSMRNYSTIPD